MIVNKSYKYQILPTKEQKELLKQHFGCVRWVWNYFLEERKEHYIQFQIGLAYVDQVNNLIALKKQEEFQWLTNVNSQSLNESLKHLDIAYRNFFKGIARYPRFKFKKNNKDIFKVDQGTKIKEDKLCIRKFPEGIKINLHRPIEGVIKSCTISKTRTNKYFASILCEVEHEPLSKTGKSIGIDLGIKDLAITSDGKKFRNLKNTKKYEKQLAKAQRHLSRKQKGSKRREKQRLKVAKVHEKITNSRRDNLHKISKDLIKKYDIICIEDLNVQGMVRNRKLAKAISDASWGTFIQFLEYKASWNDKQVIKINRYYPSSKTCNICGDYNKDLKLSERQWVCSNRHELDRDINAAKNILSEGLKLTVVGNQ